MRWLLFIILNILISSFDQDDSLTIALKIKGLELSAPNEYLLNGILIFHNKSSKKIRLPRTFDLEINLTDSLGNSVNRTSRVITEYHNLIISKNVLIVAPYGELTIDFSEWRLFLYDLQFEKKYYLQYILMTNNYKKLKKSLGSKEIVTNKEAFIYKIVNN